MIYAINYHKNKEVQAYSKEALGTKIGSTLYDSINSQAENCILDLDKTNFDEMCLIINEILLEKGLFLRIYERKQKFRYLFNQTEEKTNTIKTLCACIQTRFNAFNVAAPYLENQKKKDLYPIDIIYEPVRNSDEIIKCFFSKDIRFAYVGRIPQPSRENGVLNRPFECYYCQKFFAKKKTFE